MQGLNGNRTIITYRQLFFLTLAQLGGAVIIYLPGVVEAGRDVWISNIMASIVAYITIFAHYLPLSHCPGCSMTQTLTRYWGKFLGGIVNLLYLVFFYILCTLIVADVFFFGHMTMPETPSFVFIVFFLIPAVYGVRLGLGTFVRLVEFVIPQLIFVYGILFLLVIPKLEIGNLLPIMSEGVMPILGGALPNMNFPYAQILPIAFLYKYTKTDAQGRSKFLKYCFMAIILATVLLTFRSLAAIASFEEATLKALSYPPFSTIRLIEVGDVLERVDALLLAVFYGTTFFKFIITYYIICEIISDYFQVGKPKDFSLPVAVLIGLSMPFLFPRLEVVLDFVVPHFFIFLPLFLPIPLLLYLTILHKTKTN